MNDARFTEETRRHDTIYIELVEEWICILAHRCSEDHHLPLLCDVSEELVDVWSLSDENRGVPIIIERNLDLELCVVNWAERAVNQSLIKIEDQGFLVLARWEGRQKWRIRQGWVAM